LIAGEDGGHEKHNCRDDEQRDDRKSSSLDQESQHEGKRIAKIGREIKKPAQFPGPVF
jgi:hypothetical protein